MDDSTNPTNSGGVSRRGFLAATAVGGVALGAAIGFESRAQTDTGGSSLSSGGSNGDASSGRDGVRRNLYALMGNDAGRANIESYRRGVAAMKARSFSDPTSWTFQAAIHRRATRRVVPELPADIDAAIDALPPDLQAVLGAGNTCQHGNHFFPAWHRMYVYYLEKLVRAASGDANFMLPYWNYSDSTAERIMPEPFRSPADRDTNALFEPLRSNSINSGGALASTSVDTRVAMGQNRALPQSPEPGFYRALEIVPHNLVHGNINGLMGFENTAALDPIFWMHHCNIDRLWAKWIRDGHTDATGDAINGKRYSFIDDDGSIVSMTVREVLDTAAQLDYTYDDDNGAEIGFVVAGGDESGIEAAPVAEDLAIVNDALTLGTAPVVLEAQPLVEVGGATLFATDVTDPNEKPVYLVLEGVRHQGSIPVFYNIYVNRPEEAPQTPRNGYFAGVYYPFATPDEAGDTISFDITGLLNRQIADGRYTGGALKVEILPELADTGGIEAGPMDELTVDRLVIVR